MTFEFRHDNRNLKANVFPYQNKNKKPTMAIDKSTVNGSLEGVLLQDVSFVTLTKYK